MPESPFVIALFVVLSSSTMGVGGKFVLLGGGWLGNSLARRNVRLIPGSQIVDHHPDTAEVSKN